MGGGGCGGVGGLGVCVWGGGGGCVCALRIVSTDRIFALYKYFNYYSNVTGESQPERTTRISHVPWVITTWSGHNNHHR